MNNGKICVSVSASTAEEMLSLAFQAAAAGDVIEIRFDHLDPGELKTALDRLIKSPLPAHVIATFRPRAQGGRRELGERKEFWEMAANQFWAADLEEDIADFVAEGQKNRICSHHSFDLEPIEAAEVLARLKNCGCEIVKIAEASADICDGISLWTLLDKAAAEGTQFIPISMGEAGKWTRILGLAHGAFLTYASIDDDIKTAPGQLTVEDLTDVYRVKELDKDTKVYGIIAGSTVYTMSPYIHNAAFRHTGSNSVFVPLEVHDLDRFVRRMVDPETREVDLNFRGFSVTLPHKQAIIRHLDHIDNLAKAIGAVNTVAIRDGELFGYNTDAEGFIAPLKARFGDLRGARVAVAGTGGAARACVHTLSNENADVTIFARNESRAAGLANEMNARSAAINETIKKDFSRFDILVNATPLGTTGENYDRTIASADEIKGCRLVYDLVYNPTETRLLREAAIAGAETIGGLEMLIGQAARQFEIWTGKRAPVDVMTAAAIARLSRG
jgi:3-dehydroquinate dehydratase/shikimate dehydrogenase